MKVGCLCFLEVSQKWCCFEGPSLYMELPCLCADKPQHCTEPLMFALRILLILLASLLALGHAEWTLRVAPQW